MDRRKGIYKKVNYVDSQYRGCSSFWRGIFTERSFHIWKGEEMDKHIVLYIVLFILALFPISQLIMGIEKEIENRLVKIIVILFSICMGAFYVYSIFKIFMIFEQF